MRAKVLVCLIFTQMRRPAQDNREPEARRLGNLIEELNGPGDRIPVSLWCERRMTTGQAAPPPPPPAWQGQRGELCRLQFPPSLPSEGAGRTGFLGNGEAQPEEPERARVLGVKAFREQHSPTCEA